MSVSAQSWTSGLYGDDEIAEILSPGAEIARMLRVEAAWSRAQGADTLADEIAAVEIAPSALKEGAARDGVPVPTLVQMIRQAVSAPEGVHTGLTSQDVIDTALVLALEASGAILVKRLQRLTDALATARDTHAGREVMAFTRMQPALPSTADQLVQMWAAPLPRLTQELAAMDLPLQWGGPVGRRDTPEAVHVGAAFAAALGLRDPGHAWHTDRTYIADVAHLLSKITGALGKIGQDVALMASRGDLALRGGGGSSAMPHKSNPILAEALVTLARYNATQVAGLHQALVHEHHRSGAAWGLEHMILPEMLRATGASLARAHALVETFERIGA